jgi:hypothetical protein
MRTRRDLARAAALALVLVAAPVAAAGVEGNSSTLFDSRPYARDGKAYAEAPLYEQFSLFTPAAQLGPAEDVRVVLRAWGRGGLGDALYGDRVTGDIDVAYVEGAFAGRRVRVRLGRQFLSDGAARGLQLDGGQASALLFRGMGVEAYGGVPVVPRFDYDKGNAITGGRVFYRLGFDAELSASVLYALEGGDVAREDVAFDAWWHVLPALTVGGDLQWSLVAARTEEAKALVQWQPLKDVQVTADAARTAPDLFLPRTSIFSVFSEERRDELGGELAVRIGPRLSAFLDYHKLYVAGGHGDSLRARLTWKPSRAQTLYGVETRVLEEPLNGFQQLRVFWMHRFPKDISATLELDGYRLDEDVNGRGGSILGTATASYPVLPSLYVMAGASFGTTPYLERRVEVVARAVWRFGYSETRRP